MKSDAGWVQHEENKNKRTAMAKDMKIMKVDEDMNM